VHASPDDALVDALARSAHEVVGVLTRVAAEHDLSLSQLRVFAILRDRRRLRMSALAAHLGLDRSTLSGLVDRAERRGLLRRASDADDGRGIEVGLSAEGQAFAERVAAAVRTALAPRVDGLDAAERARLAGLLERTLAD
jgi:DNA-binding MarR family transcriptional regulator